MNKTEMTQEIGKFIINPLRWIANISFVLMIASIFVLIWTDWYYAWRTGLTGIIGYFIADNLRKVAITTITSAVTEALKEIDNNKPPGSYTTKFQKRICELKNQ